MVRRVIKIVIAAVILYAGWHAGMAYVDYYRFNDAIGELALFAGRNSDEQLKDRVMQLANEYEIPLQPDAVIVHSDEEVTQITASYTARVNLLPNYIYEWKREAKASVVHVR